MRCTHDPGTEFGGKFKELLDSRNIVTQTGEVNRHTAAHAVENGNKLVQCKAVKLMHTALGASNEYRGNLQLEAIRWARELLNQSEITSIQKANGMTAEQEQYGVDITQSSRKNEPWGCLAYGWVDKKDREYKCSDRAFRGIWVGTDTSVIGGQRIVPLTWDATKSKYELHPTRTLFNVITDTGCYPLNGDPIEDTVELDREIMTDKQFEKYSKEVKTVVHLRIVRVKTRLVSVKRVAIFHHKFACTHDAKAWSEFVAKFGLNLIEIHG